MNQMKQWNREVKFIETCVRKESDRNKRRKVNRYFFRLCYVGQNIFVGWNLFRFSLSFLDWTVSEGSKVQGHSLSVDTTTRTFAFAQAFTFDSTVCLFLPHSRTNFLEIFWIIFEGAFFPHSQKNFLLHVLSISTPHSWCRVMRKFDEKRNERDF